jgi:hypothetical protein
MSREGCPCRKTEGKAVFESLRAGRSRATEVCKKGGEGQGMKEGGGERGEEGTMYKEI